MRFASSVCALAFVLSTVVAPKASALSARGSDLQGTIQTVDQSAQTAELVSEKKTAPFQFSWNAKTTFLVGIKPADPRILIRGAKVRVTYQQPLFGKTFVSKVVLLQPATR